MQDLVAAYERALLDNGVRGWNLAQAMFILVGAFEPGGSGHNEPQFRSPQLAVRRYMDTVSPLAMGLAHRLLGANSGRVEQRTLGIRATGDVILCAAVANYLKAGDPVLGGAHAALRGLVWGMSLRHPATAVALDAPGRQIAVVSATGLLSKCDLETGDYLSDSSFAAGVSSLALDPRGAMVHCWAGTEGQVFLRERDGDGVRVIHEGVVPVTALAISPDGYLAVGDRSGRVRVIAVGSPGRVLVEVSRDVPVDAVSVSTGGSRFAAAWADGVTKVGLGDKGLVDLPVLSRTSTRALAQCRKAERLAIGTADGSALVFEFDPSRTARLVQTAQASAGPTTALGWDDSGRSLVVATGSAVRVWDVGADGDGPAPSEAGSVSASEARRDWIDRARRQVIEQLRIALLRDDGFNLLLPSGQRKFVAAASSRLAREALLFACGVATSELVFGEALADLASAMKHKRSTARWRSPCDALLRGTTLAFLADLGHAAMQEGWPRRSEVAATLSAGTKLEDFDADSAPAAADPDGNEEELHQEAVKRDRVSPDPVEDTADDSAQVPAGVMPRGVGLSLNMRPHLRAYEPVLKRVAELCEKTEGKVTCGSVTVLAPEFFRLRFATQLWCYLDERAFGAAQRPELVDMLKQSFKLDRDAHTGDALKALGSLAGKERWGASHDRLLSKVVDLCIPEGGETSTVRSRAWELEDALRRIRSLAPAPLLLESHDVGTSSGCVAALCAAMEARVVLPKIARVAREATLTLELEALEESLRALLAAAPRATLSALREAQRAIHDEAGPRKPLGPIGARLADLRDVVVVPDIPDSVDVTWLQTVRAAAGAAWGRFCADHRIATPGMLDANERRCAYLLLILDQLVDEWKHPRYEELLAGGPQVHRQKVIGFFTQLFAPTQEAGRRTWARDEWEYLAYRLAFSGGPEVYANLYDRVAAASDPPAARGLAALYRFLRDCTPVEQALRGAFRECGREDARRLS